MALSTSRTLVTKTGISTTQVFDMGGINISGGDFNLGSAIKLGNASGIITCTTFSGSGASLTNLPAGNLTGTVADARISALTASKLSGALPAISGANLTSLNASNIGSGTVPTARLGSGTANNTTFLRGDSTFAVVNTDLVADTSPQLGGNLDVNTKNIVFGDSSGASDDRLVFGAGSDLSVYHDGTNSNITNTTNDLNITNTGDDIVITANDDINLKTNAGDNAVNILGGAAVELYHNASLKFETTSSGTRTTGAIHINDGAADSNRISVGNGGDLKIFHTNPNTFIQNSSAALVINAARLDINNAADNEQMARFTQDGAVELYYDNAKKLSTESRGAIVQDAGNITFTVGSTNASGVRICLDGDSNGDSVGNDYAYLQHNTDGNFIIAADNPAQNGQLIFASGNANQRAKFNASGHFLPVSNNTYDLGTSSEQWKDFYLSGSANLGNIIRTNYDGGGHMYHKNNSQGANYSSHFQTYLSSDEAGTTQTHIHYYHGEYSELLYQGNSSVRTRSGGGVEFRNGNSTKIGTFDPDGLKFGTDTAEANAIDDYEEGSWTPVVAGWDTFTPYSGSTYYAGWYTKVGNLINVGWKIYIQHLTTVSSTAHIRIQGLPFTAKSISAGPVAAPVRFDIPEFGMSGYNLSYLAGNDQTIYMYKHVNGGNHLVAMNAAGNRSNVWTMGTATYHTN